MHKANIVAFIKTNFFMFFAFSPLFPLHIFLFLIFLDSWGVYATLHKILDALDEKPQRNNLSKLGTLKYECPQLWHSAMFKPKSLKHLCAASRQARVLATQLTLLGTVLS